MPWTAEQKRQYQQAYYAANRDRLRQYNRDNAERKRRWSKDKYASDPEYRAKCIAEARRWALANPDKRADQHARVYGITHADRLAILERQGGRCAICGRDRSIDVTKSGKPRDLHLDHDHATGKVRGLLCSSCNMGLGKFGDDPERLEAAARYLRASMREVDCVGGAKQRTG